MLSKVFAVEKKKNALYSVNKLLTNSVVAQYCICSKISMSLPDMVHSIQDVVYMM